VDTSGEPSSFIVPGLNATKNIAKSRSLHDWDRACPIADYLKLLGNACAASDRTKLATLRNDYIERIFAQCFPNRCYQGKGFSISKHTEAKGLRQRRKAWACESSQVKLFLAQQLPFFQGNAQEPIPDGDPDSNGKLNKLGSSRANQFQSKKSFHSSVVNRANRAQ